MVISGKFKLETFFKNEEGNLIYKIEKKCMNNENNPMEVKVATMVIVADKARKKGFLKNHVLL